MDPQHLTTADSGEHDETSGTETREPRPMMARVMTFSLGEELARLREEPQWVDGDRNSRTLAKDVDFRVVLTALRPGASIEERDGDARVSLHVLEGEAELSLDEVRTWLGAGRIATIDAGAPWRLAARSEAAILLTVAWPREKAGV